MNQSLKWLKDALDTPWSGLTQALLSGFPVPNGFVVFPRTPETDIRKAYDELKVLEKTHFAAVRGPSHAVLNVIGPDPLIHTLRRFWAETPGASILIQRMAHASWSGKATRHDNKLVIKANEGMMLFDPDTYVIHNGVSAERHIQLTQRKMIRHVDGSSKTIEIKNDREGMTEDQLKSVADLAERATADIAWAIDDQDRVWLISRTPTA